ncbi:MAG: type II toxin-antitoxin system RelB/DinJ family antitoxin [Candidatus Brocadiales bacterium]|nr:type II toxin-antitoxin system RelB/DinJ family antitoxin [Candidatus Brocadiales bacterium]
MSKTTTVRALMDPEKKESVGDILKRLGINHSEAINIYYSLIEEFNGLPFELRIPKQTKDPQKLSDTLRSHLKASIKQNRELGQLLAK